MDCLMPIAATKSVTLCASMKNCFPIGESRCDLLNLLVANQPHGSPVSAWGGGVNKHLPLFCARRDPTDNKWYFIDPYGIYASGSCYPSFNTPVNSPCARYPVMWKGGKAQYP